MCYVCPDGVRGPVGGFEGGFAPLLPSHARTRSACSNQQIHTHTTSPSGCEGARRCLHSHALTTHTCTETTERETGREAKTQLTAHSSQLALALVAHTLTPHSHTLTHSQPVSSNVTFKEYRVYAYSKIIMCCVQLTQNPAPLLAF